MAKNEEKTGTKLVFTTKIHYFCKKITAHDERRMEINAYALQRKNKSRMSYTAEPIIITNPSEKLLEVIKAMRERKLSKLEELRNMKSEDFTRRVILA